MSTRWNVRAEIVASLCALGLCLTAGLAQADATPLAPDGELFDDVEALLAGVSRRSDVLAVAVTSGGEVVAAGSADGVVRLWSGVTGRELRRLAGHSAEIRGLAFSPDATLLASASADGTVRLWEVAGAGTRHVLAPGQGVNALAFSPDGKTLAAGSMDRSVYLWDVSLGTLVRQLKRHRSRVTAVAFHPGGEILASGAADHTVLLWNARRGGELGRLEGHTAAVNALAFSPDGERLASGSTDHTVRLWDPRDPSAEPEKDRLDVTSPVIALAYLGDGATLVTGSADHQLRLCNLDEGGSVLLGGHGGRVEAVAVDAGATLLASASVDATLRLWDVASRREIRRFSGHRSEAQAVAVTPDGKLLAVALSDHSVRLWDLAAHRELRRLTGHTEPVTAVALSADGQRVFSGSADRTLRVWDAADGRQLQQLDGHAEGVNAVALDADGALLASGSADGTVRVWEPSTGEELRRFEDDSLPSGPVFAVTFGPGERRLAAGSADGTLRVWDLDGEAPPRRLPGHHSAISALVTSDDGTRLASASYYDRTIRLWDDDGHELAVFEGSAPWLALTFTDSGRGLAAGDKDGVLHFLDLRRQAAEPPRLQVSPLPILGLARSADGMLVAASEDGVVRLWDSADQSRPSRILLSGQDGNWIACRTEGLCWRRDDATLLVRENPKGEIEPLPPPAPSGPVRLEVAAPAGELQVKPGQAAPFRLQVTNRGTEPAYWIAVRAEPPGALVLHPPATQTVLAPGETVALPCRVSFAHHTGVSPPRQTMLRLELLSAHGEALSVLPIRVRYVATESLFTRALARQALPWGLLLVALIFSRVLVRFVLARLPPVSRLCREPRTLRTVPLSRLARTRRLLRGAGRLEDVLAGAELQAAWLDAAITFEASQDSEQRGLILAERLGASLTPLDSDELPLRALDFGRDFPLNLARCLLVLPRSAESPRSILAGLSQRSETREQVTLLLSPIPSHQNDLHRQADDLANLYVAPTASEMTELFLSQDPQQTLARLIAMQVRRLRISPYYSGGGVEKALSFFGRQQLLSTVLDRPLRNYVVTGGRQVGKSSFLKALLRYYEADRGIDCHYLPLTSNDLVRSLARSFRLPRDSALDEIFSELNKGGPQKLLLIDEVDGFIQDDAEKGYPALRRLCDGSEAGHFHFILSGFWRLYEAAVLSDRSPLKGHVENLFFGLLEETACRDLCVEPMRTLGIDFDTPDLVDRMIRATGRRADLLNVACNEILKGMDPSLRTITADVVDQALSSDSLIYRLETWSRLHGEKNKARLDRIVVYATIEDGEFTCEDLLHRLESHGETVTAEELQESLDRLALALVLRRQGSEYGYQTPLFREYLLQRDPLLLLKLELESPRENPLEAQILRQPQSLLRLRPEELSQIPELFKPSLLAEVLRRAGVRQSWLEQAVAFSAATSPAERCRRLAERLGLELEKRGTAECPAWCLKLGASFPLSSTKCLLHLAPAEVSAEDVLHALRARTESLDKVTLILCEDGDVQDDLRRRVADAGDLRVAPSPQELTALLLAHDPAEALARLIASQVPRNRISPYKIGGGIDKEIAFFGRRQLLADVMNRDPANYLLVGARQVGKSSFLKALERRYQDDPQARCRYVVLGSVFRQEELARRLARAAGLPRGMELDAVLAHLAEDEGARWLFLLDEADAFVASERHRGYETLGRLRSLSEEGRCHFVLAGFWDLYESAVLDYHSPLKNFGETLTVGALEDEACRDLCTKPMATMGLTLAEGIAEGIAERTGRRANLISTTCHEILKRLGPRTRSIDPETVEAALKSEAIDNALDGWQGFRPEQDVEGRRLDRIVVYATVGRGAFTQVELLDHLSESGASVAPEHLERSLRFLELAYVLRRDATSYSYRVPLMVERLRAEDSRAQLRHLLAERKKDG